MKMMFAPVFELRSILSGLQSSQPCYADSLTSDCKLFVSRQAEYADLGLRSRELCFLAADVSLLRICDDAKVSKILDDLAADLDIVLADTAGEGDSVNAVHDCSVSADVLDYAMLESLESELSALIAFCCGSAEVTEVRGYAGHSKNAGLLVQDIEDFVYSETFAVGNRLNNCRIHITGTCSHDEAFKRSKAHGCIHHLPPIDAEMEEPLPRWQTMTL